LHYPGIGKKSVADLALICYSPKSYIFFLSTDWGALRRCEFRIC